MKNTVQNIASYLAEDSSLEANLYINEKKYEVENFETEFQQDIDFKGQPQHEVKGGLLSLTLKGISDEIINNWMFRTGTVYDGTIMFESSSRSSTPPIIITFEKGRCISFEKMIGVNIGTQLSLLISTEKLSVNGIEHSNSGNY